jgi:ethanolamine ammonia-lyase large subunit
MYAETVGSVRYAFPDLRTLLAKASPARSGDALAGLAAGSAEERVSSGCRRWAWWTRAIGCSRPAAG